MERKFNLLAPFQCKRSLVCITNCGHYDVALLTKDMQLMNVLILQKLKIETYKKAFCIWRYKIIPCGLVLKCRV